MITSLDLHPSEVELESIKTIDHFNNTTIDDYYTKIVNNIV